MYEDKKAWMFLKPSDLADYDKFAADPPITLYHYTDLNGFYGIISSKSLRLTNLSYLNDTSELKFGIEKFQKKASKYTKHKLDTKKDADKIDFLNHTAHQLDAFKDNNVCVASFCENDDLLSQWRGYGKAVGVNIGFSRNQLKKQTASDQINLWKCIYDSELQNKIVHDLLYNLLKSYDIIRRKYKADLSALERKKEEIRNLFDSTFLKVALILKNTKFSEEHEWRLITGAYSTKNANYHALLNNDRVTLYYSLKLSNFSSEKGAGLIDRLTIGPYREQKLLKRAIDVFLADNGTNVNHLKISDIPFRSV